MPSTKSPFVDLAPLAPNIFYLDPPIPAKPTPPSPPNLSASYVIVPPTEKPKDELPPPPATPDLVVLCTWMNAAPKHIQKYITAYQMVYPSAKFVVVTSKTGDIISFRPLDSLLDQVSPVLDVISALNSNTTTTATNKKKKKKPRILVHMFSNGGSHTARRIARLYRQKFAAALPALGTVIDSAPGSDDYGAAVRAFSANLSPKTMPYPLYLLAMLGVHLMFIGVLLMHYVQVLVHFTTVQPPPVSWLEQLRTDLNDPKLFPVSQPRAYVFSDKDLMVDENYVIKHAEEAKKVGFKDIREERFVGTAHVGHMLGDATRYWGIVDGVFKDGLDAQK
jgi:Eukaryotic protein of unknown function (DUF829)